MRNQRIIRLSSHGLRGMIMNKLMTVLCVIFITIMMQGCGVFSKRLVSTMNMPEAPTELMIPPEKLKPIKKETEGNE